MPPAPKFASLQEILLEGSDAESGVVAEAVEERLDVESRRVLIDFFERFFAWCAAFRPVEGSRGMRTERVLTRFGKVDVVRRYVSGNKERPGFIGRVGRCTKACEAILAEEGCDRSSFKRAEAVSRARGIEVSASKIREVTLRRGKEEYESPTPSKIDLTPDVALGGKRRRTRRTMVMARFPFGNRAGIRGWAIGNSGGIFRCCRSGRTRDIGRERRTRRPPLLPIASALIPVRFSRIALAEEIGRKLHETALAADYGKVERVQFIADGAPWIESIAKDGFKAAIFTLDCSHAFGYVNKVCEFLAHDAKEAKKVFRKVKDRMYEHDFDRAEKYLRNKYKAHFTEDGLKHWSEEAAKAWKYLDERRRYMNYGWLRRHGYLIGSGHIESACKVIIGQRCKGAGMRWRFKNALYVTALRAKMRSAQAA